MIHYNFIYYIISIVIIIEDRAPSFSSLLHFTMIITWLITWYGKQNKMVAVQIVLLSVAVILFTIWLIKQERRRLRLDKLGGPKSLPLVGNVHQLKRGNKGKFSYVFARSKFIPLNSLFNYRIYIDLLH